MIKEKEWFLGEPSAMREGQSPLCYDTICMGGTFDHMHSGHKLLLTQACMLTKKKMIIGISADKLLEKKRNADIIEPWDQRAGYVRDFLQRLRGTTKIELDIFELVDPCGKGATEPDIDAVILTKEVEKGGHMINSQRKENGFKELPFAFVDIIFSEGKEGDMSAKTSSTYIRDYIKAN